MQTYSSVLWQGEIQTTPWRGKQSKGPFGEKRLRSLCSWSVCKIFKNFVTDQHACRLGWEKGLSVRTKECQRCSPDLSLLCIYILLISLSGWHLHAVSTFLQLLLVQRCRLTPSLLRTPPPGSFWWQQRVNQQQCSTNVLCCGRMSLAKRLWAENLDLQFRLQVGKGHYTH